MASLPPFQPFDVFRIDINDLDETWWRISGYITGLDSSHRAAVIELVATPDIERRTVLSGMLVADPLLMMVRLGMIVKAAKCLATNDDPERWHPLLFLMPSRIDLGWSTSMRSPDGGPIYSVAGPNFYVMHN